MYSYIRNSKSQKLRNLVSISANSWKEKKTPLLNDVFFIRFYFILLRILISDGVRNLQ